MGIEEIMNIKVQVCDAEKVKCQSQIVHSFK